MNTLTLGAPSFLGPAPSAPLVTPVLEWTTRRCVWPRRGWIQPLKREDNLFGHGRTNWDGLHGQGSESGSAQGQPLWPRQREQVALGQPLRPSGLGPLGHPLFLVEKKLFFSFPSENEMTRWGWPPLKKLQDTQPHLGELQRSGVPLGWQQQA